VSIFRTAFPLLLLAALLATLIGCHRDSDPTASVGPGDGSFMAGDIRVFRPGKPYEELNKRRIYLGIRTKLWKEAHFDRLDLKGGPPTEFTAESVLHFVTWGVTRPQPAGGDPGKTFQCYLDELPTKLGGRPVRDTSMQLIMAPDDGRDLAKSVVWCCDTHTFTWVDFQQQLRDAHAGARGVIRLGDGEKLSFEMLPPQVVTKRGEVGKSLDRMIERVLDDLEAKGQERR
jgi:hypothetical protein